MATTITSEESATFDQPAPRPRRRGLRWLLVITVVLVLFVALAPMLVAHTPLIHWLVAWGGSSLRGTIQIESCSLGWFSPVVVHGTQLRDEAGQTVARVTELRTDKHLLALLGSLSEPGTIRIKQPQLELVLRRDGSNLEDVLAELLADDSESTSSTALRLEIIDGSLTLRSADTRQTGVFEHLDASLNVPADAGTAVQIEARGHVSATDGIAAANEAPGDFQCSCTWQPGTVADAIPGQGTLTVEFRADNVPLEAMQPLLNRFAPDYEVAGRAAAELHHIYTAGNLQDASGAKRPTMHGQLEGRLRVQRLAVRTPAFGNDVLRLTRFDLPCKLTFNDHEVSIEQLALGTDVGQIMCQGKLTGAGQLFTQAEALDAMELVRSATGRVDAQLDLATLARLLPQTLRVREGTELRSGQVTVAASSRMQDNAMVWLASLDTTQLAAVTDGRHVRWDDPLHLEFVARESAAGIEIERLRCTSDFLKAEGSGNLEKFTLRADCDLSRLAAQLGQFIQLGGMRLAGKGNASADWNLQGGQRFAADARVTVEEFELSLPGQQPWLEKKLELVGSAAGAHDDTTLTQLDKAALTLLSGTDRLDASLVQPTSLNTELVRWPLNIQMRGALATWLVRLEPFYTLPAGWKIDGNIEANAQVIGSTERVDVGSSAVALRNVQLVAPGMLIREPTLLLRAKGTWDQPSSKLTLREASLESQTVSVVADQASLALANDGSAGIAGNLRFAADLARLHGWLTDPAARSSWRFAGQLSGQTEVNYAAGQTTINLNADARDVQAASADAQPWRQQRVQLACRATHSTANDTLQVDTATVQADALALQAAGRLTELSQSRQLECQGQITYDLAQLTPLVQMYLGNGVKLTGKQTRPFQLSGPLAVATAPNTSPAFSLSALTGQAKLGWQSADIYGLQLGATELTSELRGGTARVLPVELKISQGILRLAPQLRLEPGPMELSQPTDRVAERIRITPAMCNQALMYMVPAMAGVAEAQGEFSLESDRLRVPLDNPYQMDAAGRLTVHSVEIGAGPMIRELAILLNRPGTAKLKRESQVEYQVANGRVYHRGLELEFPELTIRTQGSVGLDQTLSIVAEMPIPPKWLGNNSLSAALKDQVIRIPIGGTLQQPRLDRKILDETAAGIVRDAAGNAVRDEVNRQLDRLLGPLGTKPTGTSR